MNVEYPTSPGVTKPSLDFWQTKHLDKLVDCNLLVLGEGASLTGLFAS